jgi:hypothetical protein
MDIPARERIGTGLPAGRLDLLLPAMLHANWPFRQTRIRANNEVI